MEKHERRLGRALRRARRAFCPLLALVRRLLVGRVVVPDGDGSSLGPARKISGPGQGDLASSTIVTFSSKIILPTLISSPLGKPANVGRGKASKGRKENNEKPTKTLKKRKGLVVANVTNVFKNVYGVNRPC